MYFFLILDLQVHMNTDKTDSISYTDKFNFRPGPRLGAAFGQRGVVACVFTSATSLAACLAYNSQQGSAVLATKSLSRTRFRIRHAAMTFLNGKWHV